MFEIALLDHQDASWTQMIYLNINLKNSEALIKV